MTKQNRALGILLSFAGYSVWVVGDTFVKLAGERISILEILCISFWIGACFTLVMAKMDGGVQQIASKRPKLQAILSILNLGATAGSVIGVTHLSLANFYTIAFCTPLILTILGSIFLKEKVSWKIWSAILFGFCGILIAVRFSGDTKTPSSFFGVLAIGLGSICFAFTMLIARFARTESSYALTFWSSLLCGIVTLLILLFSRDAFSIDFIPMIYAILCGILGGLGGILTNASLRMAPVAIVSPYHYTQIVGGALVGYFIWHQIPAFSVVMGGVMIIISGLYILQAKEGVGEDFVKQQI